MKQSLIFLSSFFCQICFSQIDPSAVTIARDTRGVPHIFAKTDAEVACGLAWAHAEDDFKNIQFVLLTGKGMLGRAIGKKGAEADYIAALLRCREIVEEKFSTLTPAFIRFLEGYVQGLNDYARTHSKEVLVKKAFPATVKELLAAATFSLCVISGLGEVLPQVIRGNTPTIAGFNGGGSNAFAIHPSKTTTGEAFLAINSHQPLEGPVA